MKVPERRSELLRAVRHLHIKRQLFADSYQLPDGWGRRKKTKATPKKKKARRGKPSKQSNNHQTSKEGPRLSSEEMSARRSEYERIRRQDPEFREKHRFYSKEYYWKARDAEKCRPPCKETAKPGETRCKKCAEKHRISRRMNDAKRYAKAKLEKEAQRSEIPLMQKLPCPHHWKAPWHWKHPQDFRTIRNSIPKNRPSPLTGENTNKQSPNSPSAGSTTGSTCREGAKRRRNPVSARPASKNPPDQDKPDASAVMICTLSTTGGAGQRRKYPRQADTTGIGKFR